MPEFGVCALKIISNTCHDARFESFAARMCTQIAQSVPLTASRTRVNRRDAQSSAGESSTERLPGGGVKMFGVLFLMYVQYTFCTQQPHEFVARIAVYWQM